MNFKAKKLPAEAAIDLRLCPIHTVEPYALMLSPVYLFMRINQKFVSVKSPLDFFTPEELARLEPSESFFFPKFVETAIPFRDAGRSVRAILNWKPNDTVALPPASYEVSDAVIHIIGPLWSLLDKKDPASAAIEPFFTAVFANEFCELLPPGLLMQARDTNVEKFECAVLRSSWAVFLALHLGYCQWDFLNELRIHIFQETLAPGTAARVAFSIEIEELARLVSLTLAGAQTRTLNSAWFAERPERVARKIASRIERIKTRLVDAEKQYPTIHGAGGFAA